MLAATRARPSGIRLHPTIEPAPTATGEVAVERCAGTLAAEGRRAGDDDPLATPGDRRRRWLAGPLGRQLTTGGTDLLATIALGS